MKTKILSILALLLTVTQGAWADATDGMLTGRFTVNAQGKKVAFSQGNLQAVFASAGSSCTWRFAANQWDYVGNAAANNSINGNGSVSAAGSVDLFGWSTPATTRGIHNSQSSSTYSGDFADWGTLAITNGGNTANSGWRTLTKDEWGYLINTRTSGSTVNGTTNARYTHATIRTNVSGVNGVILFPDGVTISADEATAWGTINGGSAWGTKCTAEQWTALAAKGCVFLPAAGYRYGSGATSVNSQGFYWSSTPSDSNNSLGVCFYTNYMNTNYSLQKWAAHAVRLVITTYTATFADDNDNTGWTIAPASGAEGTNVTATYNGSRHVKSVTYKPAGTIGGQFTINNSGDKVYFAKGNLQYIGSAATPYWKFADNQWDYLGTSTGQNSSATNVNRDLFGWGTKTDPYKTSDQSGTYSWNEWGENAITNGGNKENSGWFTPLQSQWSYLFATRTASTVNGTSNARYCKATVNGVRGIVLFPDSYTHPTGVTAPEKINIANRDFTFNNWTADDWTAMEVAGCVFLPAAGWRNGTTVEYLNTDLCYYSSTNYGSDCAYRIAIAADYTSVDNVLYRKYGCSVRLVRPVVELSPNAEKTVWTLASMPDYDIELSAEYYDEVTLTDGEAITGLDTYKGQEIWVNYTRSFTADKASTVCLPFAYTKKTGDGSFYEFTGIEEDGNEYIATMTEPGTSELTANRPYLYKPSATGPVDFSGTYAIPKPLTADPTTSGGWTFKGTYSTIAWESAPTTPTYGFSAQDTNDGILQGQFVKVGSYVRIKPMRAYLEYSGTDSQFANARSMTRAAATTSDDTLPETIGVRLVSANGEVTAIGTLHTRTGEVSFDSEAWYTLDGKRLNAKPNTKGIYVNNGKKVVIK